MAPVSSQRAQVVVRFVLPTATVSVRRKASRMPPPAPGYGRREKTSTGLPVELIRRTSFPLAEDLTWPWWNIPDSPRTGAGSAN
jgi:hypothetical protein